jgi:hypothetical protein
MTGPQDRKTGAPGESSNPHFILTGLSTSASRISSSKRRHWDGGKEYRRTRIGDHVFVTRRGLRSGHRLARPILAARFLMKRLLRVPLRQHPEFEIGDSSPNARQPGPLGCSQSDGAGRPRGGVSTGKSGGFLFTDIRRALELPGSLDLTEYVLDQIPLPIQIRFPVSDCLSTRQR